MGFVNRDSGRWPNGEVPIVTGGGYARYLSAKVPLQEAIEEYAKHTPITIRSEKQGDQVVLLVTDDHWLSWLLKCYTWSNGRNYAVQVLNCQYWNKYSLMHEFGHVIGLHHEMTRPDRDKYVKINFYMLPHHGFDWNIKDADNDLPIGSYDCNSLMHYNNGMIAVPGEKCASGFGGNGRFTNGDLAAIYFLYPIKRLDTSNADKDMLQTEFQLFSGLSFENFCLWFKPTSGTIELRKLTPGSVPGVLWQKSWPADITNVFSFSVRGYFPEWKKPQTIPPDLGGGQPKSPLPNSPPSGVVGLPPLPGAIPETTVTIPIPIIARYHKSDGLLELFEVFTKGNGGVDLTLKANTRIGNFWTHFVPFSFGMHPSTLSKDPTHFISSSFGKDVVFVFVYSRTLKVALLLQVTSPPNRKIEMSVVEFWPSWPGDWSDFVVTMGLDAQGFPTPYLLQYSESNGLGSVLLMRTTPSGIRFVPLSYCFQTDVDEPIECDSPFRVLHSPFFDLVYGGNRSPGGRSASRISSGEIIFKSYFFKSRNYLFVFEKREGTLQIWRVDTELRSYDWKIRKDFSRYSWQLVGETTWGTGWDSFIPYTAPDTGDKIRLWYQLYNSKTGDIEVGRVYADDVY